MPDLEKAYASRVSFQRMFDNICRGVLQTFRWPYWELKQIVTDSDNGRLDDKIHLTFSCFKDPIVIDVSELRGELSLAVEERYLILGHMAGQLLEMRCNEAVPSNVELGEN